MIKVKVEASAEGPEHWHWHFAPGVDYCEETKCLHVNTDVMRAQGVFGPTERIKWRRCALAAWQAARRQWPDLPPCSVLVKARKRVRGYTVARCEGGKGGQG